MRNLLDELTNWEGDKILMVVFPHPDDETVATGGLLMAAKKFGWKTMAVILTQGEAGQNRLKGDLATIRQRELGQAVGLLNVDQLVQGHFKDGKLRSDKKAWSKWLDEQISKYHPSWIVTYDHTGATGHPDHISLSVESKKLKSKIWWVTFNGSATHRVSLSWPQTIRKYRAMFAHRSQFLPINLSIYRREHYHEVDSNRQYEYKFVEFKI